MSANAGRITFYVNVSSIPTIGDDLLNFQTAAAAYIIDALGLKASGKLYCPGGTTGTTVLSTATWYRIAIGYSITSTVVNQFKIYLNGNLEVTCTNAVLSTTGAGRFLIGDTDNVDSNQVLNYDDIYADNGTDLSDPGDIRVTAKRPNAAGALNNWTTRIGAGGSGYGTGHSPQVNEQPLSQTNGWSIGTTNTRENYGIEGAGTGDVDISAKAIVADEAWIWASITNATCTAQITNNGVDTAITLTTTPAIYTNAVNINAYPINAATVGVAACSVAKTNQLYEAGMLIAYLGSGDTLTNFPVLVKEASDANLKTAGNAGYVQNASGYDMIFTDSTETTKLDHEMENYVPTTGEIEMWVRIPTLSAAVDTVIYLYYDNASISTSQENKTGVWDANYKGVWHMAETGAATTSQDSTSNAATATKVDSTHPSPLVAGEIGGAQTFEGTTSQDTVASAAPLISADKTAEAWVYVGNYGNDAGADRRALLGKIDANNGFQLSVGSGPSRLLWNVHDAGVEYGFFTSTDNVGGALATNTWYHLVGTYVAATHAVSLYVNGVSPTNLGSSTWSLPAVASGFFIGEKGSNTGHWQGNLDEERISNTVRSGGWIATEYNDQSSPSTFLTFGAAVGSLSLSVGSVPGPVLVQHNEAHSVGNVTTLAVSLPAPPALNDLLVVVGGGSVATTDTLAEPGGTYTLAGSAGSRTGSSASIWYKVAGAGESATVSITGTSGSLAVAIQEWSGLAASTPLDQTANNVATGAGTTAPTGTTSATTVPSELVIAGMAVGNNAAGHAFSAWSVGYTTGPIDVEATGTLDTGLGVASQVVAATGTQAATATWTTSGTPVGVIATFKASGGTQIIAFPTMTLDGTDKSVTQTVTFTVADTRGTGAGWAISGTGTQFSDGNGHTLPTTATKVAAQPVWTCSGGCTLASSTCTTLTYTLPTGAATAMCTTGAATGLNIMTGVVTFTITVPGNQVGIGTYQSTWTFTIA